ncbi:ATP-dependent helicase HrpB [Thalassotalea sp. PLHSN55]|uniref:ATP-dependent helicase HrpB n=1 Tax=Thalassotalea sp. PLHSN55 TaxID=3435888 RepID=UPI003F826934
MTTTLPVEAIKAEFLQRLVNHNTLVLSAPPGAGKSTCLPLWLLDLPALCGQKIYLLQPRRVAAKNIACFLAQQLGEKVGQRVGYRLRNDSKVSQHTQIEVITEGILTQIIQADPEIADCGLIILDEFHERSLNGDLALALALDIQQGLRDDLKILLMSATLAVDDILSKLPDAYYLKSEGRSFTVDIEFQPPSNSRIWRDHALSVIKQTVLTHQGSTLVFLPGAGDIRFLVERLTPLMPAHIHICPLFGELSLAEQQQAIAPAPAGQQKLVLATNIAETSLTIDGVNLVIDCGLEKVAKYDAQSMTNKLQQQAICKASAIQRAGRAGRLMPGKCIRLFSEEDFERRSANAASEIQQADLLPLLIEAARWGVSALHELPLIERPLLTKEDQAWQELIALNIIDQKRRLTSHGETVSQLATHPRFAHMICQAKALEPKQQGLTALACLIAALLEERDIFSSQQAQLDCDLRHRLDVLVQPNANKQGRYQRILKQATRLRQQVKCKESQPLTSLIQYAGLLLALAYPERIAQKRSKLGEYLAQNGKGFAMQLEDALADEVYIVAAHISAFKQTMTIRLAAPVDLILLEQWQVITPSEDALLAYDVQQDKIIAEHQQKLGAIVLNRKPLNSVTDQQRASLWQQQVAKNGLAWLKLPEQVQSLLLRWRWLNNFCSSVDFPLADDESLMANLPTWFTPFVGQVKNKQQLQKLDFQPMLMSLLDYQQQQQFAKLAPTHFIGPTGRKCMIRYNEQKSPTVSLPMQELYGQKITPSVGDINNNNAIALVLELLSPAQRPIQVTQDLPTFWQGSYRAVQKDMKARYPKHYWPDDPANAEPTNKTKRHILK